MPEIHVESLVKDFGDQRALDDVSFDVADGELFTLLGPSGCGKSTTLMSIAGFVTPDAGRVAVGDDTFFDASRRVVVLEEPFSNLDAKLRERARTWVKDLQHSLGLTTIFVTHDQDEALSMSDRVVVMDHGVIQQVGTPEEVYRRPANRFVAEFVGRVNLLSRDVVSFADGEIQLHLDGAPQPLRVAAADA